MYVIIGLIVVLILMLVGLNIRISDIKKIKQISEDNKLNKITDKLPSNIEVCKDILDILKNKNVKIEENTESNTSLYMAIQNKIIIGNIDNKFTRIQTIAHECIHSIQNKKILYFNIIFSNFYIIYFAIIFIIGLLGISSINNFLLCMLIAYSFIYVSIRSFLELDAMNRARYIAEKYIDKKVILSINDKQLLLEKYDEINNTGIKLYYITIILKSLLYILAYCIVLLF